jgi:stearoyl-CoA desaturase (delta-9 desaturase)
MNYKQKLLLMVVVSAILVIVLPFYISIGWEALVIIPVVCYLTKGLGSEIGAHRLWSHNSFDTSRWVKRSLIVLDTLAGEGSVIAFVGIHRLHHMYSDTPDDPHWTGRSVWANTFYQHNVTKFNPRIVKDLFRDPWLVLQHKYYFTIQALIFTVLALISPTVLWYYSVNVFASIWINYLVNVVCHTWGSNDNNLDNKSRNNLWADVFLIGVGQHNNHHARPGATSNCWYDVWGYIIRIIKLRRANL